MIAGQRIPNGYSAEKTSEISNTGVAPNGGVHPPSERQYVEDLEYRVRLAMREIPQGGA